MSDFLLVAVVFMRGAAILAGFAFVVLAAAALVGLWIEREAAKSVRFQNEDHGFFGPEIEGGD